MKLNFESIPNTVQFEMTYSCNSNCIFCYNPNRGIIVDKAITNNIVDILSGSNIYHIQLTGGELSLVPQINEYIKKLKHNHAVTIVTNGLKKIENLYNKLDAVFVSLHGQKETHEYLTNNKNTYEMIINTIKYYVDIGIDVYTDTILTSRNYNELYSIVETAKKIGVKKCYINRYEIGGIGSKEVISLMPNLEQFKVGISQMIKAKKNFNIDVGFCTAIPFCIDARLAEENLDVSCGIGTTFGVINPVGDLRICNQSNKIYGNILTEPIEKIWKKNSLNDYRCMKWVKEPCKSCRILDKCIAGCRVDNNCSDDFCIDYYLRKFTLDVNIREKNIDNYIRTKRKKVNECKNISITLDMVLSIEKNVIIDEVSCTVKNGFILINTDKYGIKILKLIDQNMNRIDIIADKLKDEMSYQEIKNFICDMMYHKIISSTSNAA